MSRRAFFLGLIVIALLIVSLYRAKYGARDTAAELMTIESNLADARREKALLETELSHMSRRDWIEEYAREELGMRPPKPEQLAREGDLDRMVGPVVPQQPAVIEPEPQPVEPEPEPTSAEAEQGQPVVKAIAVSAPKPQPQPEPEAPLPESRFLPSAEPVASVVEPQPETETVP